MYSNISVFLRDEGMAPPPISFSRTKTPCDTMGCLRVHREIEIQGRLHKTEVALNYILQYRIRPKYQLRLEALKCPQLQSSFLDIHGFDVPAAASPFHQVSYASKKKQ